MTSFYKHFNTLDVSKETENIDQVTEQDLEKMKKGFHKALELETTLEDIIQHEADQAEKSITKTHSFDKIKRVYQLPLACVGSFAALLIVLLGINTFNPSFAQNFPVLGDLITTITGSFYGDASPYITEVNQVVSDSGVTIQMNELLIDDNKLRFAYTLSSDDYDTSSLSMPNVTATINGKNISLSGTSGSGRYLVDNNQMAIVTMMDIHTMSLPNYSHLTISFDFIDRYDPNDNVLKPISGDWTFDFDISKAKINALTQNYKLNIESGVGDNILTFKHLRTTPISTAFDFVMTGKEPPFDYIMVDDMGKELQPESSGYGTGNLWHSLLGLYEGDYHFSAVSKEASKLTVMPYTVIYSDNKAEEPIAYTSPYQSQDLPIRLIQDEIHEIIITDVTFIDNHMYVAFTSKGYSQYMQFYRLGAQSTNDAPINRLYDLEVYEPTGITQTAIFEKPSDDTIIFYATGYDNYTFYPDKAFEIDLD